MSNDNTPQDDTPRHRFRDQVKFLKPYWTTSDQKWKARLMLGGIVGLTAVDIALTAGLGFAMQAALNALVAQNLAGVVAGGSAALGTIGASALTSNTREYMTLNLGQNWRGWLTKQFTSAWLGDKTYLRLQHDKKYAQNPDQRIAETASNVANNTLSLGLNLFRSVVGAVVFSVVLWHISPLMVAAAGLFAGLAHVATFWTGGSMHKIWKNLMNTEAKFRHALVRVRDNAKPIALAGLEPVEKEVLKDEFNKLDEERRQFYKTNWRVGLVGALNWNTASLVPIALSIPKFMSGAGTLGGLELARQAYGNFYGALSWLPQGFTQIAGWSANVSQLMEFQKDLDANKADMMQKVEKPAAPEAEAPKPPPKIAAQGPKP